MEKTCLLFAGQGSQYPQMGIELTAAFPSAKQVFEAGSDILGFDLLKACAEYPAEELSQTEISQPAIMATSLAAYEAVKSLGITPDMVAGHSLGEYAAMTAAGMLTLENAFRVIRERARGMGECAKTHNGAMCAILGLSADEIAAVCEKTKGFVIPVNFNSPAQTVIAGEADAVDRAAQTFAGMGKRTARLAVSAAFHSKFMQPAADDFKAAIADIPFAVPKIDFYSNVTGEKLSDFSDMPSYLAKHLVSPVQFVKELNTMQAAGASRFIECGPNKVLTGLVRKTLTGVSYANVENLKTLEKLKASLA